MNPMIHPYGGQNSALPRNENSYSVNSIFDQILILLSSFKNLFNNQQLSAFIDPIIAILSRLTNFIRNFNFNLDFFINLFVGIGLNSSFDFTATSETNTKIH